MLVSNDDTLYEKVLTLNNHGRSPKQPKQFWAEMIGFKYKLSNIQAAIVLARKWNASMNLSHEKRQIFEYYTKSFHDLPVTMNPEHPGTVNGYWMPTIVVNKGVPFNRENLLAAFKTDNIDGRVFFLAAEHVANV